MWRGRSPARQLEVTVRRRRPGPTAAAPISTARSRIPGSRRPRAAPRTAAVVVDASVDAPAASSSARGALRARGGRRSSAPPGRRGRPRAPPRREARQPAARWTSTEPVLPEALAEDAQRARKPEVVERLGPQLEGDPAHLLEAAARGLLRLESLRRVLGHARASRRAAARRRSASGRPRRGGPGRPAAARPPARRARAATLSRRSASSRSSISLNAAQLGGLEARRRAEPRPGSSGSIAGERGQPAQRRKRAPTRITFSTSIRAEAAGEERQLADGDARGDHAG